MTIAIVIITVPHSHCKMRGDESGVPRRETWKPIWGGYSYDLAVVFDPG